ncbi:sigma-54 interaction domain-containing protein [Desulfohalovibrio reitneri]|uniref:sigma-54 interaction domain-containing protein n=1 Tax=Desulfohalovibrio reitneri TaxID=1307759 RepID=UPI0004A71683|nr:sigma-54-dependent Fis family transcriptional regulator [Desulfohalovibrio reitneri]
MQLHSECGGLDRHLEKILDTMHEGLVFIAPDGRITLVNQALCDMLGYGAEELLGRPCTVLGCDACESVRTENGEHWCKLFERGRESRKPCTLAHKGGGVVRVLKNARLLEENGRVTGAVETLSDVSELEESRQDLAGLKRLFGTQRGFMGFIGESPAMRRVYDLLERAAASEAPVIILGESGTGKELAARAIHELGRRAGGPYIQCNCAALNESLLESELFGHAKGAFTGAVSHRVGRFEAAHGGDLFLDEIGDVPLELQVKLLRVLETKRFERVGEHLDREADARIITATNKDLEALVAGGGFRQDLFYRINVIPVRMPPLRERKEDVPLLADHFVELLRRSTGKDIAGLSPEAMELFMAHDWPGNVRELKSALEYAFVLAESGRVLPEHLPGQMDSPKRDEPPAKGAGGWTGDLGERDALVEALRRTGGNKSQAARLLGVTRMTVLNRMRKYGVDTRTVITP